MGRVRWVLSARIPHLTPTLSAPQGGEGDFQLPAYRLQYALDIFHHIPVPEPDHTVAVPCDLTGSSLIIFGTQRVLPTIKLDHQLCRRASEIDDIRADRVLPTKPLSQPKLA